LKLIYAFDLFTATFNSNFLADRGSFRGFKLDASARAAL